MEHPRYENQRGECRTALAPLLRSRGSVRMQFAFPLRPFYLYLPLFVLQFCISALAPRVDLVGCCVFVNDAGSSFVVNPFFGGCNVYERASGKVHKAYGIKP